MTVLGILLGVFLLLLVLGVPIAVAMGMGAIAAVVLATDLPIVIIGQRMMSILDTFPFLALPFFVVAGLVMERGGITQQLIDFATIFVARITGGLAQVVIGANLAMSGASGAATADCAATGTVMIPALARAGYSPAFAAAVTAAASTLGPIIPPSVMFVIYGAMTNTSIGKLFLGGVIPGLIMGAYMIVATYIISKRRKYPKMPAVTRREAGRITIRASPALLMPVIVVGGIVGGVFTPTEAGAVAAVYALVIAIGVYRRLKWSDVLPIFIAAATMTAAVMLIVSASEPFGWILARERIPDALTSGFRALTTEPWIFLACVNILLLLFGIFFEPVPLLILMAPVLMPLLPAYAIDPVHFGVMITLNMTLGLLTPPVGMCMFIVCQIGKVTIWQFTKEVWPFLIALGLALLVVTYVPATVLFLPNALVQ
jgi:tripartite ATP-independent transporter DctM subunit